MSAFCQLHIHSEHNIYRTFVYLNRFLYKYTNLYVQIYSHIYHCLLLLFMCTIIFSIEFSMLCAWLFPFQRRAQQMSCAAAAAATAAFTVLLLRLILPPFVFLYTLRSRACQVWPRQRFVAYGNSRKGSYMYKCVYAYTFCCVKICLNMNVRVCACLVGQWLYANTYVMCRKVSRRSGLKLLWASGYGHILYNVIICVHTYIHMYLCV